MYVRTSSCVTELCSKGILCQMLAEHNILWEGERKKNEYQKMNRITVAYDAFKVVFGHTVALTTLTYCVPVQGLQLFLFTGVSLVCRSMLLN